MNGDKCPICKRGFSLKQKMVRVVVELVSRDPDTDGKDEDYWSQVEDWDSVVKMHLACVQRQALAGVDVPYGDELNTLALFENGEPKVKGDEHTPPPLKLVKGGL